MQTSHNGYIWKQRFMEELRRYRNGSVTRRHFLGVTGLGTATAVPGAAVLGLRSWPALAQDIGDRVVLATWVNYHDKASFDDFTDDTGAFVRVYVFGSNEEMLVKLPAGGLGWDVFVPTNYTITTHVAEDLIEPLDVLKLPNYDAGAFDPRLSDAGTVDRTLYAVPKNWGTTGFAVNTTHAGDNALTTRKDFFDRISSIGCGRSGACTRWRISRPSHAIT